MVSDFTLVICDHCRVADFIPPGERDGWEQHHNHDEPAS